MLAYTRYFLMFLCNGSASTQLTLAPHLPSSAKTRVCIGGKHLITDCVKPGARSNWAPSEHQSGYFVLVYIPVLGRHLVIMAQVLSKANMAFKSL